MMIENYADGGRLIERWDESGYTRWDESGAVAETRALTDGEARHVAAIAAHEAALASAPPSLESRVDAAESDIDSLIVAVLS